jgi:hypothetical protein
MIVYFMYDSNFNKPDKVVPLLNYAMEIDVWGSGFIDPLFLNSALDENGQLHDSAALPPSTLLQDILHPSHHLLNILVLLQIANKLGLSKLNSMV